MKKTLLCLLSFTGLTAPVDARSDFKVNVQIRVIATGDDFFIPYDINDLGDVVGSIGAAPNKRAARWTADGGVEDLGAFGSEGAFGFGINNSGQLAIGGYRTPGNTWETAARWTPGVGPEFIPTPGGADALARGINAHGVVAGMVREDVGGGVMRSRAMRYSESGGVETVPPLDGDASSWAMAINDHGWMTGWSGGPGTNLRAFVGTLTGDIVDLSALDPRFDIGMSINNNGQVVGFSFQENIWLLYTPGEGVISPGTGTVYSMNSLGHVVGVIPTSTPAPPNFNSPFFWSEKTGQVELNSLLPPDSGWVLRDALGINDRGEIAGWGQLDGVDSTFILTIPTPGSCCVLVAIGLFAARRRR